MFFQDEGERTPHEFFFPMRMAMCRRGMTYRVILDQFVET